MKQALHKSLANGVGLTIVPTDKFKTSAMRIALVLPLGGAQASAHAVLPSVLRRGTAVAPDLQTLGRELDGLYGARVEPMIRKIGDSLAIGFVSDVIDETYAAGSSGLTARAAELLCAFWRAPLLENGAFKAEYADSEKENLAVRIEAQRNNPRAYAPRRLIELMCAGENFGQSEFGTAQGARALTAGALYEAYQNVLQNARIELFYCGAMAPDAVEEAFQSALFDFGTTARYQPTVQVVQQPKEAPKTIVEEMPVKQGKLSMGFRTGITGQDAAYPAMVLANTVFGGSTNAKLFLNVREKLSLCYYASSTLYKQNGVLTVASGIENKNFEVAREEILKQLHDIQLGSVSDDEVEAARLTVRSGLCAMQDSPMELERFWLGQSLAGYTGDLHTLSAQLAAVTRDEIIAAANHAQLDTIYFLKGDGE